MSFVCKHKLICRLQMRKHSLQMKKRIQHTLVRNLRFKIRTCPKEGSSMQKKISLRAALHHSFSLHRAPAITHVPGWGTEPRS